MKGRKIVVALVGGALALMLAACGGPTVPTAGSSATVAASSGWDINEQPRSALASGVFVGAITNPITTWNTFSVAGNDQEINFLESPINPTYYDYDGLGRAVINTDYLLSATTKLEPNLVVTLKLNPKAVWNDGKVISATDWIATWKALNGKDSDFSVASTGGWDQVTSVKAGSSNLEVVITFVSTYPDWTSIVASGPMRAEGVATAATFNSGWAKYVDAYFTGPFRVAEWNKTSGTVVMEPNPRWWGAKPLLTKITWKSLASDSLASAFVNQEIDYYDIGADADGYQRASSAPNSVVRESESPVFRQFTFNSKSAVLSDVNVRQAIVMGLDRSVIAESDLAGLPGAKVPLNNNLYMVGQPGYVDQAKATGIDYDPQKAAAKLDAAGWKLNSQTGYREKNGKQLDVTFVVLAGITASENEGLQSQKMLKQIGVNLKLKSVSADNDFESTLLNRSFDIFAFSWSGNSYPLNDIGQIYGGTLTNGKFTPGQSNFAALEIPEVLTLKPKIDAEMDSTARAALGNQAARAIWEAVHTLPLYQRPSWIGVRAKLANIGAFGMARVPKWENVGYVA